MPITFPSNPLTGDTAFRGGKTWVWDGERWMPNLFGNVVSGGSGTGTGSGNVDGGGPTSVYGGITGVDGGGVV